MPLLKGSLDIMKMLILLLVILVFHHVEAQPTNQEYIPNFKPNIGVIVGILGIVFILTSILFFFSRFCQTQSPAISNNLGVTDGGIIAISRFSGIDKKVIESLPFFKFSLLRGSKEGLECAVCLSKFEDIEVLRLLPKCKHAFHIDCVDKWLEEHSTCPLCRCKVSANDLELLAFSNSFRFLENFSDLHGDSNLEIFVQREEGERGSSRFGFGNSSRKAERGKKEKMGECGNVKMLHKLNHKIVVSDIVSKNRWSNVSSSDLMFLESEMLGSTSTKRFSSFDKNEDNKEIMEKKVNEMCSSRNLNRDERRSMSEITIHTRFDETENGNGFSDSSVSKEAMKEEKIKRIWLPIARKTVEWFVNREERSQYTHTRRPSMNV